MNDIETPLTDEMAGDERKRSHPFWRGFWLLFLVVSLAYAWHSFYVPENEVEWAPDTASAYEVASESRKPVLLFFTSDWCVPCRIMKREVFADGEVSAEIRSSVVPVMINAGQAGADEIFERFRVKATPVTILTDSKGELIDYAVGGLEKSEFLELLAKG